METTIKDPKRIEAVSLEYRKKIYNETGSEDSKESALQKIKRLAKTLDDLKFVYDKTGSKDLKKSVQIKILGVLQKGEKTLGEKEKFDGWEFLYDKVRSKKLKGMALQKIEEIVENGAQSILGLDYIREPEPFPIEEDQLDPPLDEDELNGSLDE